MTPPTHASPPACAASPRSRSYLLAAAIAALLALPHVCAAQRFLGKPATDSAVAGRLLLRVTAPPSPLDEGEAVAVRLDGKATELCRSLPWQYSWDTSTVADGLHTLELLRANVNTGRELIVDVLRVRVQNRTEVRREEPTTVRKRESETAFHTAIDPLQAPSTALYAAGGLLYIGTDAGGVVEYTPATKKARALRIEADGGVTKAIAVTSDDIWWLTAPADTKPAKPDPETPGISIRVIPPRLLCRYARATGKLTTMDVDDALLIGPADSPTPQRMDVRSIVPWQGRVILVGNRDARVIDPRTGRADSWATILPDDAGLSGAALAGLASDGRRALAVVEAPAPAGGTHPVRQLWAASSQGAWRMRQTLETGTGNGERAFTFVTPERVVTVEPAGVTQWRVTDSDVARTFLEIGSTPQLWGWTEQAAIGAGHLWWSRSGRVFHANLDDSTSDVLMPWRGAPRDVAGLVADDSSAWIAGPTGVVRVDFGKSGAKPSYGGYVRARLGAASAAPKDDTDRRMAQIVQEWQGVPYKWGGSSKSGTDCSGFVMAVHRELGVDIPHGSKELRSTSQGIVVKDELRYGDVLTYPGHCALYIGDGRTAETVAGGVGMASIYGRDDVVVRRFLRVSQATTPSRSRRTRQRTR